VVAVIQVELVVQERQAKEITVVTLGRKAPSKLDRRSMRSSTPSVVVAVVVVESPGQDQTELA
jgi:hypothetical protein